MQLILRVHERISLPVYVPRIYAAVKSRRHKQTKAARILHVLHPVRVAVQCAHIVFQRSDIPQTHGCVI